MYMYVCKFLCVCLCVYSKFECHCKLPQLRAFQNNSDFGSKEVEQELSGEFLDPSDTDCYLVAFSWHLHSFKDGFTHMPSASVGRAGELGSDASLALSISRPLYVVSSRVVRLLI